MAISAKLCLKAFVRFVTAHSKTCAAYMFLQGGPIHQSQRELSFLKMAMGTIYFQKST